MKSITFPLQIGIYGEPKVGKSHLAAGFAKEFGGMVIEPVVIQQLPPKKGEAARYVVDQSPYGHSAWAIKNVGLDFTTQYAYVKSWSEYQLAVDALVEKTFESDKRLWLIIDDSDQWRRLYAYHLAMNVSGRKQVTKEEFVQAGGDLITEMNRLKNLFNTVYISQMKDEYVGDNPTGRQVAAVYPTNAKFIYEIYGKLYKNRETKKRDFDVELLTVISDLDDFAPSIHDVTPKKLLEKCGVDEDFW
jgi:hypothetical protein